MSITSIPMLYKIYMYHKGPLMVQNVEDELNDQLDGLGRVKQRDQLVVCQTSRYYIIILKWLGRETELNILTKLDKPKCK